MNAQKKIFFISSFLLSILFICLFSHSVFSQIEAEKTIGFEKKNETLLDKEAFRFVNTIIDQHWLIYGDSWFTISGALIQMKDVAYEVEIQKIKEVDRMNGIEWKGYFYIYPKFTRERNGALGNGHNHGYKCRLCGDQYRDGHTTFKTSDSTWGEWYAGHAGFPPGSLDGGKKRIYRYEVWKTDGKWTFKKVLAKGPCISGWCIVGGLEKPKTEELPDFMGSGKLKERQQTSTKQFEKSANTDKSIKQSSVYTTSDVSAVENYVVPNGKLGEFRHGTFPSPPIGDFTHVGVDIVAPCGSDIYAFSDGKVKDIIDSTNDKNFNTLGYMVLIEHPASLIDRKFYTLYLHMQRPPEVKIGNQVTGGRTVIGNVGSSGKTLGGCHTHFEIRYFPERFSAWGNIYCPDDQRYSEYFKQNWEDPLTFFRKYPNRHKLVKIRGGDNNADKSKLILGSWKDEDSKMEYFRDGTFISNADIGKRYTGTWSIEGNILRLQFINPLRVLNVYTIIEMTDSTYKIKLNNADRHISNARRIEPTKQSPVYTAEKSKIFLSNPRVRMETNYGTITLELYPKKSSKTVENFLQYVSSGFYDGTIFHRVIKGFMIQGGGLNANMQKKSVRNPINNEAYNELKNLRGTVTMARTNDPHSATSQFFINTANNTSLDYKGKNANGWGYCVFGKVVEGMGVVNTIENLPTITKEGFHDVPVKQVIIESVIVENDSQQSNSATSGNNERSGISNKVSSSVFAKNNSNVFHKSNCPELGTEGLIEFASSQKARKSGGVPCSNCNP